MRFRGNIHCIDILDKRLKQTDQVKNTGEFIYGLVSSHPLHAGHTGGISVFYARRVFRFYGLNVNTWYGVLLSLIPTGIALLVSRGMFSTGFVMIAYLAGISLVLDLLVLIIRHVFAKADTSEVYGFFHILYRCGALPVVITALVMVYGFFNFRTMIRTDYTVDTQKDAGEWTVVLLTDTHYDAWQPTNVLKKAVEEINAIEPDLVILGGDIVEDGTSKESMEEVFRILGDIPAKNGVYYVYGNHDETRYFGSKGHFTNQELKDAITENGIHILQDERVEIDGRLTLAGRGNAAWGNTARRMSAETLLAGADPETFIIVADHQPVEYEQCAVNGADLLLSGHTHAGQIWPVGLLTELSGNPNYGLYHKKDIDVIVSSGAAGWGYSIRTGAHCEYVVIHIQ